MKASETTKLREWDIVKWWAKQPGIKVERRHWGNVYTVSTRKLFKKIVIMTFSFNSRSHGFWDNRSNYRKDWIQKL